ncbi:MAG: 23S rRNA (adenine(2030)-N(6))-methyltransferase RlmJ [Magnetococcales bacterium]|nr:23S rRNA (adenine(2030)-N(6))-methyltransferase RlmJ [Magnetococcales bacterium]MBF0149675.1 23S rRNA (adenine(2030)-N(6))-methyltransferase RlmJ [Magnetococcales bacterium]MBF0173985.1 23S rRNA (adenine(2030)-N(6))-methyltransferase RlmJ [Magnetococcales bacterium]MBF0346641.1 23S rRNA (adenine(2030)-N(6))-methyltransferase RlmJ [Magnetococcales bacterium]MBF0630725.1 23S rRNA (adenine(2030)-N(6))-methyltransferase RlmJ [Magnetococcales bacterium]
MLSYQHDYHAGGPADVHKHASLAVILARMTAKDQPMTYIESHSGGGVYDLESPMAAKTGEAQQGIQRLLAHGMPREDHPYRQVIEKIRARFGPAHYPGSPWLARLSLRPADSIHLMELHPGTLAQLRQTFRGEKNVHIHHRNGYEGVLALLPPTPRRCLVLVDPSYEVKTEYEQVGQLIPKIHRKCPGAVIMVWYPLLKDHLHPGLCHQLERSELPKFARREVFIAEPQTTRRMYGSGLMFVNLPHGVDEALAEVDQFVPQRDTES